MTHKQFIAFFLFFLFIANASFSQSIVPAPYYSMVNWDTSPYKSFKLTGGSNVEYNTPFRLLWPKNYDSTLVSTDKYPLVIMLHGGGESALGNSRFGIYENGDPRRFNNDHQLLFHGREYLNAVKNGVWPGFVMFPQNKYGDWLSSEYMLGHVVEIIETLSKTLKIDPNRIFITGLSAGGNGVWAALARYPHLFAAGLSYSGIGYPTADNTTKVAHIPIWYFQGEVDGSPPKSLGDRTIKALRAAGGTPIYTVYPQTGHNTWDKAIREPEFFPFMLGHSKLSIHAYFGKTEFDEDEAVNVKLAISPGFAAYEWRKDGVAITDSDTSEIVATALGNYTVRFRRGDVWTEWSEPLVLKLKNAPVIVSHPANITKGAGQSISFSVKVQGDDQFTYQWQKAGVDIPGATDSVFTITAVQPSDAGAYRVVVSNAFRSTISNSANLVVNTDLYAVISTPVELTKYKGGQTISYSGSGADLDGVDLESSGFSWELKYFQPNDTLSVWIRGNSKNGTFLIPTTGQDYPGEFYRLILTVTGKNGASKTVSRDIHPHLTTITLDTQPAGLQVSLDSKAVTAAFSFEAVEGKTKSLSVASPQVLNGITYNFSNWSQSGNASQTITVPENDITYTAVFVPEDLEPVVYIDQPSEETMYRGGQVISFQGSGTDSKGKPLTANAFAWTMEFHHPDGISSVLTKTNSINGSYTIPSTGPTSPDEFYRLILTITDPNGTKKTVTRDLIPYTTTITFATEPETLKINLESTPLETPFSIKVVEGKSKTLEAITPQTINGKVYKFSKWSQGGTASQTLIVPKDDVTYTAFYEPENVDLTATISAPLEGAVYKGGQTIAYSGSATDSKGDPVQPNGFSWELEYTFSGGVSSIWTRTNSISGSFVIPTTGKSSTDEFYRLILTITDPSGLKKTISRKILPLTATVNLATEPEGLKLTLDTITLVGPYSFESVVGKAKSITAITPQIFNGKTYKFLKWKHGGAASQTITVPQQSATYTAVFEIVAVDPIVMINLKEEDTLYRAGETISYFGKAINSNGDSAEASTFTWDLELHRANNIYPVFKQTSVKSGSFTIPTTGKTSSDEFYRLKLTVADPNGSKKTQAINLFPLTSKVTLATEPSGLNIKVDSISFATPYSFEAVEGKIKTLDLDSVQTLNGKTYRFSKWKHGGDKYQTFDVQENDFTYTAIFELDSLKDPLGEEDQLNEKNELVIFPNPATDLLVVKVNANAGEKIRIEIISSIGQPLLSFDKVAKEQGLNALDVDVSDLSSSSYIIRIRKEKEAYFRHIIINR